MQKADDPLNLRSLPLVSPPEDGWPAVRAALEQRSGRQRTLRIGGAVLAVAASVSLAVGLFLAQPASDPEAVPVAAADTAADRAPPTNPAKNADSLIALSQQLEARLRTARHERGSLPTATLIYAVELEDTIAMVDDELSRNPASADLWSQRVNLLLDLGQLYSNQLRRDYLQTASL